MNDIPPGIIMLQLRQDHCHRVTEFKISLLH